MLRSFSHHSFLDFAFYLRFLCLAFALLSSALPVKQLCKKWKTLQRHALIMPADAS
jgi:hypothetical protein